MAKRLFIIVLISAVASLAKAEAFVSVYLADGNTPLEHADPCVPGLYRDIMIGMHLTIIISSDTGGEYWGGGIYISDPYRDNGILSGRDYNEETQDWGGSHLEAAGPGATVWEQQDSFMSGFELATDVEYAIPGDWFIFDYNATNVGDCSVGFYDYNISGEPVHTLSFIHVSTRDFDNDYKVSFTDFATVGLNWQRTDCIEPENCSGTDLDTDGDVDYTDLKLFVDFWLETTG